MHSNDAAKLRQYMEKVENLEVEKNDVQEQISDVYGQAKSDGFDPRIMRKILRLKRMKTEEREAENDLLDTYMLALGLIPGRDSKNESES